MALTRFTLDTNCVIDVEEGRVGARAVLGLLELARQGKIDVAIPAIGASEKQRNGGYAANFSEFQEKLAAAGFDGLELLMPIAYLDVGYWDWGISPTDTDLALEEQIHGVLFPSLPYAWSNYASSKGLDPNAIDPKWKNAKCDVLALWTHVRNGRDVFVTNDQNFHSTTKRDALVALGVGVIATPEHGIELARGSRDGAI